MEWMAISNSFIVRLFDICSSGGVAAPINTSVSANTSCSLAGGMAYLCEDIDENVRCVISSDHFAVRLNRSFLASAVFVV
jgi:hypothetical protein